MAGGGSSRGDEGKKKARIEIIPLIDVIFFLLATFVLFTLSLNKIKSLKLELPVSDVTISKPNPDDVTIQVSADGTLYWNKSVMELEALPVALKSYKSNVSDPRILVSGDETGTYGTAIRVLDEIKRSGIKQYSVETRPRATGG